MNLSTENQGKARTIQCNGQRHRWSWLTRGEVIEDCGFLEGNDYIISTAGRIYTVISYPNQLICDSNARYRSTIWLIVLVQQSNYAQHISVPIEDNK